MAANTPLNVGTGPINVRDIDLGSQVKAEVTFTVDPGLIQTVRATYTSGQTDVALITVSAGSRIGVTEFDATISNDLVDGVLVRAGFGVTNTPTTTGVVFSHPKMFPGQDAGRGNGSGFIGVGADGVPVRLTTGSFTGTVDCVISYMLLPTAGI